MIEELYRVEQYEVAIGRGMTSQGDIDSVTCAAWSSKYNALGHAMARLEASIDQHKRRWNASAFDYARKQLEKILMAEKVRAKDAFDIAGDAIRWYCLRWCILCNGTGVINIEQHQCQMCSGTGEMPRPVNPVTDRAISHIKSSIEQLEIQQRKRMSGSEQKHYPVDWNGGECFRSPLTEMGFLNSGCVTPKKAALS